MPKVQPLIYQLKITLKGSKPPIWRRFLVKNSMKLSQLQPAISIIMGWGDYHLHQFFAGGMCFGVPDPEYGADDMLDQKKYKISDFLVREKDRIGYEYDFGDSWNHTITLEKILPFDKAAVLPFCLKGKGACPPEDVGGLWGYYEFLEAIRDEKNPEHENMKEWIGGDFDPDAFNVEDVNIRLAEVFRHPEDARPARSEEHTSEL